MNLIVLEMPVWSQETVSEKPCCSAAAKRKIVQLMIGDHPVGLSHLDETMTLVRAMDLRNDDEIGEALIRQVRIHNYVPASAIPDYLNALLQDYRQRLEPIKTVSLDKL